MPRIYGQWAGNSRGNPEDTANCVQAVWNQARGMISNQCSRKRGFGPEGLYCKQHGAKVEARRGS